MVAAVGEVVAERPQQVRAEATALGVGRAVLISAALFGTAGGVLSAFPTLFVLGILYALLREWCRSLWPAVAANATLSIITLVAAYQALL